jgi:hypothetical protein
MTLLVRSAWGRTFGLELPENLVGEAEIRMPFGSAPSNAVPERIWSVATRDFLDAVTGEIELWLAEHAEGFIFVHAGCVAVDGRAIVLPGRTMSGKSTLVGALVRAGATYYSDEYAAVDRMGRVHPYARLLSLREQIGGAGRRTPVADLGGAAGSDSAPMGLVAHLRYDESLGWSVAELSRSQIALALIDNTVPAQTRPLEVMDHLQAATGGASGLRGTRGDAEDAARRLIKRLSESA